MPEFVYNDAEDDGLPKIKPTEDPSLLSAVVRSRHMGPQPKKTRYTFADLSGAGTIFSGRAPERIVVTVEAFVETDEQRLTFANKLRQYEGSQGRYTLQTERGEAFPNTELRSFRPTDRPEDCLNDDVWCGWELVFEWMQPATEIVT